MPPPPERSPAAAALRSSHRSQVPPFEVMAILDRVAELRAAGRDVVSLCAGEPSGGAPVDVRALAAELFTGTDPLGYTPALGDHALRRALADHHRRWYGIDVDPRSVAVTTGASGAFLLVFLAAFDAGDRVAIVRPGYPAYRNVLTALDLEAVEVPVGAETGFQPTVEQLEAAVAAGGPVRGLVLASPANPTGSMIARADLAELVAWCAANGVRLVSDEIYHGITYPRPTAGQADETGGAGGGAHRGTCAWELDRRTVVVSSFSKYWGMTGWRLGWALVPDDLVAAVDALAGNVALCPPTPAQRAALGAFTDASYAEADARVRALATARAELLGSLDRLGWGTVAPADGAFYLWADVSPVLGAHDGSPAWCRALLEETGVAVVPGTDMDRVDGHRFVRISFAAGADAVREAVHRITTWQVPSGG